MSKKKLVITSVVVLFFCAVFASALNNNKTEDTGKIEQQAKQPIPTVSSTNTIKTETKESTPAATKIEESKAETPEIPAPEIQPVISNPVTPPPEQIAETQPQPEPTPTPPAPPPPAITYICDCSKTCTQIKTCEEAYYQLNNCGCAKRDNNHDGVPCEDLCR